MEWNACGTITTLFVATSGWDECHLCGTQPGRTWDAFRDDPALLPPRGVSVPLFRLFTQACGHASGNGRWHCTVMSSSRRERTPTSGVTIIELAIALVVVSILAGPSSSERAIHRLDRSTRSGDRDPVVFSLARHLAIARGRQSRSQSTRVRASYQYSGRGGNPLS